MKKLIKWVFVAGAALIVLLLVVLLVLPRFVDIQKYKPRIEEQISSATGRTFALGGDLHLSLFPWAGVSSSDLHLGNPRVFREKDFVSVKSFEIQVKLLPLLFRDIRIKRFVVDGARIVLEKGKDGRTSWGGIGKASAEPRQAEKKPRETRMEGFLIKDFTLGEFAITNGSVLWIDHGADTRREISDVTVRLQDVSLDSPITFFISSLLDGKPLSLKGSVGPLGKEPGTGSIPLTLAVNLIKEHVMVINGTIDNMTSQPRFDLALNVPAFSPRKLMAALNLPPPVTKDPKALKKVSLKAAVKGDQSMVALSKGVLNLDDSKLAFSARVKEFSKPDVTFDLTLDRINADRYLPPPGKKKDEDAVKTKHPPPAKKKPDYTPLRKLRVNGHIKIGELTVKNARMQDLDVTVTGDKGVFVLKPLHVKLYDGSIAAEGSLNVARDVPRSVVKVYSHGIQVNPLLNDVLKKDILEGTMLSRLDFTAQGDDPDGIKRTLNGAGQLVFSDGAIKGFDLAAMVRNVKDAFTGTKTAEKPRTDFTEFRAPFTAANGVVNTQDTSLKSPFIRIVAKGNANLADESLDFRIEPKVVGTLKGQGDEVERSGIMVPVKVTGTFSAPRFAPDLESLLKQQLEEEIPKPSELKEILKKKGIDLNKDDTKLLEEGLKGLMKDVFQQK
jgi:AsmA protein